MACSVCRDVGHQRGLHVQMCVICGGDRTTVKMLKDVDRQYRCADDERHQQIRDGFGSASLMREHKGMARFGDADG